MEAHAATTPFGRRPMSLGLMATQALVRTMADDAVIHKWRILRALTMAKDQLGLSDRALSVLDALLTFHPETVLTPGAGLVVFPSNRELALRARGPALKTLQRALAQLMLAGLVIRRDSPNGKRYARRGEGGAITDAFGFDLSPLIARAAEFEALAAEAEAQMRRAALLRERITLHRRDVGKTIAAAVEAGAPGDWEGFRQRHEALSGRLGRNVDLDRLTPLADALAELSADIAKALKNFIETKTMPCSDGHCDADNQTSNTDTIESEPAFQKSGPVMADDGGPPRGSAAFAWPQPLELKGADQGKPDGQAELRAELHGASPADPQQPPPRHQAYPLGMVLDACPDIAAWSRSGVGSWPELLAAAAVARSALGISPSAHEEARSAMGEIPAAIVIAAIVQKAEAIRSPGGYLRSLTEKAREGQFSLGPILMALLRARLKGGERKRA